ncbi:hypothetical protein C3477_24695 [Mycobacterium kansasii]|uniref:hypothetical protein n=1 Tax=Mycobacterium kansasii TaxID=1768 RepID=UPI000CDE3A18|nr:hypothetical protein [Mycobacterium kansasii]POX92231.1 hypothetical protein C3B43_00325 [Mycobacterium kansasii]POX97980.1 hypothetical protein C3477_24695 [Mycobacterium kansasii]POY24445.1 hypothetical protein C3476_04285 [Mycobacterium kansasii]
MTSRIAERASAIRHYLSDEPDKSLIRKYSFVAARWEEMKLAQINGKTTPAEDASFRELTKMLRALTEKLDLGDEITTSWRDFLPGDPQRLLMPSWEESARMWFA